MKKIWHPFTVWEDYKLGMWRKITGEERKSALDKAIQFTGDAKLYGSFMVKVLTEMPFACEQNLTGTGNKRAWIGHAAVCLALGIPEDVTREAWGHLTTEQQDAANAEAQFYIDYWVMEHEEKNRGLHQEMGVTRVS
jgi:hypothetical protein